MIKGITTIRKTRDREEFEALKEIFDSLGFERGTEWQHAGSRGSYFLAPVGKLEVIEGRGNFPVDVCVEVSDLDSVSHLLKTTSVRSVSNIQDTDWGGRVLVAEPAKGIKIAFWQKDRPDNVAVEGELNARGMRFAIVVARWNSFITERLLQGALDGLRRSGCRGQDITVSRVPGSFEITSQAMSLAETGNYDAIITLGCLIRGKTTHYDHIATDVTQGILPASADSTVAHSYGVLTCASLV